MLARPLLLLALLGCGGPSGSSRFVSTTPRRSGKRPDVRAMRVLLERFSPTSHAVVATYERLPTHFAFGGGRSVDVSDSRGFDDYFTDASPSSVVDEIDTAVHETYHAYAGRMALQLEVEAHGPSLPSEAVFVGGRPLLVSYVATYPSREMAATFTADARTRRFATYVSPSQPDQSTQQEGVYGLLDEMAAYYHGAHTLVDLWPWVRDEAPRDEQMLITYAARFHEMWVPRAEFELFVLHYLRHARDHHPDVYRALVASQDFRRAFAAVDDAWAELLARAGALEPTLHAFARGRGVDVAVLDGRLTAYGLSIETRDDAYPAVLRELASEPYQSLRRQLR